MTQTTRVARTGLLAMLMALIGFSYSLATTETSVDGVEPAARAVGTNPPLAFANPFVSAPTVSGNAIALDRDLGDAVAGSSLVRLVRAKGGVAPYTFTAGSNATNGFGSTVSLASAQIQLLANGILTTSGTFTTTSKTIPAGPFRFSVTVKDSYGTAPHSVTETFRLTFVTTTQFRFATSALPDGLQFTPYSTTLPVLNGKPAYTYAVSGTGLNGSGLTLSKDGSLYGVPTVASVTFTATATDANGKVAAGQSGTGVSQTYTVAFAANKKLSSGISATYIEIKTGFGHSHDGVDYRGIANLGAASIASLSGKQFAIRIGTYTGPTANFDGNGAAVASGPPALNAAVKRLGVVYVKISQATVSVGTVTGSTVQLPVELRLGGAVVSTEVLTFTVKSQKNGGVRLSYRGASSPDTSGAAQLTRVRGSDDAAGTGDAWKVAFLGRFPTSLSVASATSVDVAIGTNSTNKVALTNANGVLKGSGGGISSFHLNVLKKGFGSFTTTTLTKATTAIPTAAAPGTAQAFFATNMTFSNGSGIESSLAIYPKNSKWASK